MSIALLNLKRCDKYIGCPASKNCPASAINCDVDDFRVIEEICTGCAECQNHCDLFYMIETELDRDDFEKMVSDDPMDRSMLMVERFSADIVNSALTEIKLTDVDSFLADQDSVSVIELIEIDSTLCLNQTIPVFDVIRELPYAKIKVKATDLDDINIRWGINSIPTVLVFDKTNLLGFIPGEHRITKNNTMEMVFNLKRV